MRKHRSEFDDHLYDLTREPDTEVRAKMPGHRFELDEFFFELGREAIGDVRAALIEEAWFGRVEHSRGDHDHASPSRETTDRSNQSRGPFSDRWSAHDEARTRGAREPDHEHELDFDR